MYRIEVAPGEETVFRTIEELAVSIRNGVVTHRARIYHHASQKWLPIVLHPHYKKALEMPAARAPHAPVTSTTPIPTPSRSKKQPSSQPQLHSEIYLPEPKPTPEPKPVPMTASGPKIPTPVPSPVIAMQNEVLRDLPVISLPEPLPWTVKRSPPVAPTTPAQAPAVDTPAASAPPTIAPVVPAPAVPEPVIPAPVVDAPVVHAPVVHAPVVHAPVVHAPVVHAPVVHAPVSHAPVHLARPFEEPRHENDDELPIHRPTARRSRRMSGRPLLLLGVAAALVVGTHLVLTATPSASADPSEAPPPAAGSEEPASASGQPAAPVRSTRSSPAPTRTAEPPRVSTAPARVPMTPGPAFSGSVPARPGADSAGRPRAVIQVPAPEPEPAAAIAPAPAAIELSLPGLPPDSVVPAARTGDTLGMKRILRALNGTKSAGASTKP